MPSKRLLVVLALGWVLFHFVIAPPAQVVATDLWSDHPVVSENRWLSIDDEPVQVALENPGRYGLDELDLSLHPQATFELRARVLSSRSYRLGQESRISPLDLALGWGPMADESVLDEIEISQRNRWFYWRSPSPPIPEREINRYSSNMHMMAANEDVMKRLRRLREGDEVTLRGHLVDVRGERWRWNTSTSRTDTGDGACEIVLVQELINH